MNRKIPQPIDTVLGEIFDKYNLTGRMLEIKALEEWERLVGQSVESRTLEKRVEKGVLTVRITSAALRQELIMCRSTLVRHINNALGQPVLTEVRII